MIIRLTPLRTVLLFIPFIISAVLGRIQVPELQTFLHTYYISDHLFSLNLLLLIWLQAYFLIRFNDKVINKLTFFKINALIPVIYVGYWFIRGIYLTINKPHYIKLAKPEGPVSLVALGPFETIIALLLFYSLFTFFFLNNNYVSSRIKKIGEPTEQAALTNEFLNPMRLIVKASWIAIVVLFVFVFVNDILAMTKS
ncbi:hypothetical protein AAFN85_25030 [Mucilaginibacter sp. CAU 1740]|uniref:hypothetical protein n=1 Tax=Mucilaginibacter sp. CAU 1740 TaxID=3140365 RepID=UPI00325C2A3E